MVHGIRAAAVFDRNLAQPILIPDKKTNSGACWTPLFDHGISVQLKGLLLETRARVVFTRQTSVFSKSGSLNNASNTGRM